MLAPRKVELPDLSYEEWNEIRRLKSSVRTWRGFFNGICQALYETVGAEKAIEVTKGLSRTFATPEIVEATLKRLRVEDRGVQAMIAWEIIGCHRILEAGIPEKRVVELFEESPTKYVIRWYPPCPMFPPPSPDKTTWIPKGFCREGMCSYDYAIGKLINPKLEVTPGKMIEDGDPYCETIIELKD